jgi:hypothetical protein
MSGFWLVHHWWGILLFSRPQNSLCYMQFISSTEVLSFFNTIPEHIETGPILTRLKNSKTVDIR